jgi:NodT family efflux transporter outer membrane factor (OMF) lipoprotein
MVPADHSFARANRVDVNPAPVMADWWAGLHDPELNRLESAALAASPDLAAARARVRESRAELHARRADLLPTTGSSAAYIHSHSGSGLLSGLAGGGAGGSSSSDLDLYSVGFDATWEADLFGAKRRGAEAAAANTEAQIASLADARVSLTAEVGRAYVSVRDLQHRLALEQASAKLHQQELVLGQQRAAAGAASEFDVERLNEQVQQTLTDIVPLQAQLDAQMDELAVLTGRLPGDLDAELASVAPVPVPPATVSIGDPTALLQRRPDIREAERQIAAKNAAIGQHLADYFPKLQILGDIGYSSTDVSQLFSSAAFMGIVAPVLQWKPFDFGRTAAAVEEARAGLDEAEASYRSTVLKALEDAESSLSKYGYQRKNLLGLQRVFVSASRAASLARDRYRGGTIGLTDLLDTERTRYQAEEALAQGQAEMTRDYIALQKSLGLGWRG